MTEALINKWLAEHGFQFRVSNRGNTKERSWLGEVPEHGKARQRLLVVGYVGHQEGRADWREVYPDRNLVYSVFDYLLEKSGDAAAFEMMKETLTEEGDNYSGKPWLSFHIPMVYGPPAPPEVQVFMDVNEETDKLFTCSGYIELRGGVMANVLNPANLSTSTKYRRGERVLASRTKNTKPYWFCYAFRQAGMGKFRCVQQLKGGKLRFVTVSDIRKFDNA